MHIGSRGGSGPLGLDAPNRNLILILGDQLTPSITSLAAGDPARDLVPLMAELGDEALRAPSQEEDRLPAFRPCVLSPGSCAGSAGRSST